VGDLVRKGYGIVFLSLYQCQDIPNFHARNRSRELFPVTRQPEVEFDVFIG